MLCSAIPIKSLEHAKSYYTKDDEGKVKDDYYANNNERDMWGGEYANRLGLKGRIHHDEFETMLNSVNERLKPLMKGNQTPNLGVDLTFSSSKSVSLAIATESPEISAILENNHRRAVSETMKIIEADFISKNISQQRLLNGEEREITGKAVYGKFKHNLSRYLDVQDHSHVVIYNETLDAEGKRCSVDLKYLMENQKLFGAICQNLEMKYNREAGFIYQEGEHGYELAGYSDELIEEASKARSEIKSFLEEKGLEVNAKNCQYAWNQLRPKKNKHADYDAVKEDAKELCAKHRAKAIRQEPQAEIKMSKKEGREALQRTLSEIQDKEYAFTKNELYTLLMQNGAEAGMTWEQAKNLIVNSDEIVDVGLRRDKEGETRQYITTKSNIKLEEEINRHLKESQNKGHKIASKRIEEAMQRVEAKTGAKLKGEQSEFVRNFLASSSRVYVLNGRPGTGKTFTMRFAKETMTELGYKPEDIQGASFQKAAAIELEHDSGIESNTIDSILLRKEKEAAKARGEKWQYNGGKHSRNYNFDGLPKLKRPAVLVVDEAGMTDDTKIKALMDYSKAVSTDKAPLTLLFCGDYNQIQAIGIGGAYERMASNEGGRKPPCPVSYLNDITRQKDEELKQAVLSIVNDKDTSQSFQILHKRSLNNTFEQWQEEPDKTIKADNEDIASELNKQIRTKLKENEELKNEQTFELKPSKPSKKEPEPKSGQIELAEGDKVIISKAEAGREGKTLPGSSQIFEIERIENGILHGKGEDGKTYTVNTAKLHAGQIKHAYAVTSQQARQLDKSAPRDYIVAHGGLREISDTKELESAAVSEYVARLRANDGKTVALSVETNAQRQRLNRQIRDELIQAGDVEKKGYTFEVDNGQNPKNEDGKKNKNYKKYQIEVAKGDRLICLKNDSKSGLYNNLEGVVRHVSSDGWIELETKEGIFEANLTKNTSWDHAYAKTVNKLQGGTFDTIIAVESRANRNSHFVAISRARTEGIIFTTNRQRLEASANKWVEKVTADSFVPSQTEKGEYMDEQERAKAIREAREPNGAEIEAIREREAELGRSLTIADIQPHAMPKPEHETHKQTKTNERAFAPAPQRTITPEEEIEELAKSYEAMGDKKILTNISSLDLDNVLTESMRDDNMRFNSMFMRDDNGRTYCILPDRELNHDKSPWGLDGMPKSKSRTEIRKAVTGKEIAGLIRRDCITLLKHAINSPENNRIQAKAITAKARITAFAQIARNNKINSPSLSNPINFELTNKTIGNILDIAKNADKYIIEHEKEKRVKERGAKQMDGPVRVRTLPEYRDRGFSR